jgi:hypothetical protein
VVLVIASNLYYFHDALVAWWKTALFILFTISAIKMRQFSRRRDAATPRCCPQTWRGSFGFHQVRVCLFSDFAGLDCPGISMIGSGTPLECSECALIWAVLPPDWIFGVVCEISLASLFAGADRTQSLQIAHHVRFAPGQSIAIQVQRVHPAQ